MYQTIVRLINMKEIDGYIFLNLYIIKLRNCINVMNFSHTNVKYYSSIACLNDDLAYRHQRAILT